MKLRNNKNDKVIGNKCNKVNVKDIPWKLQNMVERIDT